MINLITLKKHLDFRTLVSRLIVTVVMCLPAWGIPVLAQEAESYVVFDAESATLTFRHDAAKPEGGYALNEGLDRPQWLRLPSSIIKKVVFDASFAAARPTTCRNWFSSCSSLKTVEGLANLNTEAVTDMNSMFYYCPSLKSLDLSTFNTANVTDMSQMFFSCDSLTSLNVSGFNTSKVTKMDNMFNSCLQLPALDVSSFNTENVTSMDNMFTNCRKLKTLDLKNFDTRKVTSMDYLFNYCQELTSLDVSGFNTENVKSMDYMFSYCLELLSLDVSNFNTQNVTSMHGMFYFCTKLPSIDVSKFDTRNVKSLSYLFGQCNELASVDVSHFNTQNVTDLSSMFCYCRSLAAVDVTNFDTRNTKMMGGMFQDCKKITTLDLSNFNTKQVYNMKYMFSGCRELTTIYATDLFDTSAEIYDFPMFRGCYKLVGAVPFDGSKLNRDMANYTTGYFTNSAPSAPEAYAVFDADNKTLTFKFDMKRPVGAYPLNMADEAPGWRKDIYYKVEKVVFDESFARAKPTNGFMWFDSFSSLKAIDGMEHLNTEEMSNMSMMFNGFRELKSIDLSRFNTEKVTDMSAMFKDCNDLTVLDLSTFCTDKVVDMNNMFCHCSALTNIYVSDKFVVTALTMENAGTDMFAKCDKLRGAVMYDDEHTGKEMANFEGYLTNPNGTGIGNVDASRQGEVEYYDLSGRRLSVPQKGVGIMRTGNKTRKSVVR